MGSARRCKNVIAKTSINASGSGRHKCEAVVVATPSVPEIGAMDANSLCPLTPVKRVYASPALAVCGLAFGCGYQSR